MSVSKNLNKDGLIYFWSKVKELVAGAKGTTDYSLLENKPAINGHALTGDQTAAQLGINIPTDVSDLNNDANYQTAAEVNTTITGKGYQTSAQVETAITGKGYQTATQVETAITGKGYQTATQVNSAITAKLPTKVSALTNDSGYQTSSQVSSTVASAIANITQFDYKIVTSLPTTGVKGTIYLVATGESMTQDIYREYIWIGDKYEEFGPALDLSGYVQSSDLQIITNSEIDSICV